MCPRPGKVVDALPRSNEANAGFYERDCPEFSWLKGLVVLVGLEGHVYCLKLDRGELSEAALPALAVVGSLDPDDDRKA